MIYQAIPEDIQADSEDTSDGFGWDDYRLRPNYTIKFILYLNQLGNLTDNSWSGY